MSASIDKKRILEHANAQLSALTAGQIRIGSEQESPMMHALVDALVGEFNHALNNIRAVAAVNGQLYDKLEERVKELEAKCATLV